MSQLPKALLEEIESEVQEALTATEYRSSIDGCKRRLSQHHIDAYSPAIVHAVQSALSSSVPINVGELRGLVAAFHAFAEEWWPVDIHCDGPDKCAACRLEAAFDRLLAAHPWLVEKKETDG